VLSLVARCSSFDEHSADQMLHRLENRAGVLTDRDRAVPVRHVRILRESNGDDSPSPKKMDQELDRLVQRVGVPQEQLATKHEEIHPVLKEGVQSKPEPSQPDFPVVPTVVCNAPLSKETGIIRGKVRHALTLKPLPHVKLEFDHSQGRCVAASDQDGNFKVTVELWSTQASHSRPRRKVKFTKDGFEGTTANFVVQPNAERFVETFDLVPKPQPVRELGDGLLEYNATESLGVLSGALLSSATGKFITTECCKLCNAAKLHFRHGVQNEDGEPIHTHAVAKDAVFKIPDLKPGSYTMQIDAPCYVPHYFTVAVIPGQTKKL